MTSPADTLAAYLDHLVAEVGASPHTVAAYRRDLTRYTRFLTTKGLADLDAVTPDQIEQFAALLRTGDPESARPPMAPSSVARAVVTIRSLPRFAPAGRNPVDPAPGGMPLRLQISIHPEV